MNGSRRWRGNCSHSPLEAAPLPPTFAQTVMRQFNVIPHRSIGPIKLGMTRQQVRELLGEPSAVQVAHEKWGIQFPDKDYFFNNAFQVSYDADLHAELIEAAADPAYRVTFDGIPVHDSEPSLCSRCDQQTRQC